MRKSATVRKKEIIEMVLELSRSNGVARLSTDKVASALGLSQPAIFRHFTTKQELWEEVADHLIELMVSNWDIQKDRITERENPDPLEAVLRLATAQLSFLETYPAVLDIVFSRELHHENEALRTKFLSVMEQFIKRLDQNLFNIIPAGGNSNDYALLVGSLIKGTALRWSLSGRSFDLVNDGRRLLSLQLNSLFANTPPTPRGIAI